MRLQRPTIRAPVLWTISAMAVIATVALMVTFALTAKQGATTVMDSAATFDQSSIGVAVTMAQPAPTLQAQEVTQVLIGTDGPEATILACLIPAHQRDGPVGSPLTMLLTNDSNTNTLFINDFATWTMDDTGWMIARTSKATDIARDFGADTPLAAISTGQTLDTAGLSTLAIKRFEGGLTGDSRISISSLAIFGAANFVPERTSVGSSTPRSFDSDLVVMNRSQTPVELDAALL